MFCLDHLTWQGYVSCSPSLSTHIQKGPRPFCSTNLSSLTSDKGQCGQMGLDLRPGIGTIPCQSKWALFHSCRQYRCSFHPSITSDQDVNRTRGQILERPDSQAAQWVSVQTLSSSDNTHCAIPFTAWMVSRMMVMVMMTMMMTTTTEDI